MTDLVIIGAGPAGATAAIEARRHGLSVTVLDENAGPGGRIWQAIERRDASDVDDAAALATIRAFRDCGAEFRPHATVWAIEPDGHVFWSETGHARSLRAETILISTGTTERPMPIPGWTLPGVMTVGAAQIALKTGGLVPGGQGAWLAGQGPLLLLYAVQALRKGGRIAGVIDLSPAGSRARALRHLPAALRSSLAIGKGLKWRGALARAGIPWRRADSIRAEGDGRVERVIISHGRTQTTYPADLLLLHDGVIPSVQLTRALGCEHVWDSAQRCWRPAVDDVCRTTVDRVRVAGDGAGVLGAEAAVLSGRVAVHAIACDLGRIDTATRDRLIAPLRVALARQAGLRRFLDTLFPPRVPDMADADIVCRCEEVTAGRIRQAVSLGCLGLNQLKAFTRCGMGPCQGRMCAPAAAEIMARARGVPVEAIEPFRLRFPTKPLTIGELAALHEPAA